MSTPRLLVSNLMNGLDQSSWSGIRFLGDRILGLQDYSVENEKDEMTFGGRITTDRITV